MKNLKIFVTLILLLSLPNLLGASAVSVCRLAGLGGTQPKEACQIRDFLRFYEEKKKTEKISNAYVFYGETGTGKSVSTYILARESKAKIIELRMLFLFRTVEDMKAGSSKIREAYQEADNIVEKTKEPVLIIIEEMELISHLTDNTPEYIRAIIAELNEQLKLHAKNANIITILVTNRIQDLDKTLSNRCQYIEWPLPSEENRKAIIWKYMNEYPQALTDGYIKSLPRKTYGLTGRDIEIIFKSAHANANDCGTGYINDAEFEECLQKRLKVYVKQGFLSWLFSFIW